MDCSIYKNIQTLRDFTPKKAWPSATTMTYAMAWEHCWQSAWMTHSHKPQERSHQRLVATWSQSVAVCRPSGSGAGSPASRLQKFLAFFTELHIEHLRTWTTTILCGACGVRPSRIATRLHSFSDSNDWEQRIAQTLCSHSYSFMSKETLDYIGCAISGVDITIPIWETQKKTIDSYLRYRFNKPRWIHGVPGCLWKLLNRLAQASLNVTSPRSEGCAWNKLEFEYSPTTCTVHVYTCLYTIFRLHAAHMSHVHFMYKLILHIHRIS